MITIQRLTIRLPDNLYKDIQNIAKENGSSINYVAEQALKGYRDKCYMEDKATIINEEIISMINASNQFLLQQINHKSNKLLSELAIQNAIQNMILSNELDVNEIDADNFRKKAVEFLKTNNRILRLDEII